MQLEKKYYTVQDEETLKLLHKHILDSEVIAVDTETTGLNPRKDKIVGWSVSGEEGVGFYLPTLVWNFEKDNLEMQTIMGESTEVISKKLFWYRFTSRRLGRYRFISTYSIRGRCFWFW